jgi:hypothetical protein
VRLIMSFTQMWTCYPTNFSFQIIHIKFNIISHHKSKKLQNHLQEIQLIKGLSNNTKSVPKSPPQPNHRFSLPSGISLLLAPELGTKNCHWHHKNVIADISLCSFQFSMQNMYWVLQFERQVSCR